MQKEIEPQTSLRNTFSTCTKYIDNYKWHGLLMCAGNLNLPAYFDQVNSEEMGATPLSDKAAIYRTLQINTVAFNCILNTSIALELGKDIKEEKLTPRHLLRGGILSIFCSTIFAAPVFEEDKIAFSMALIAGIPLFLKAYEKFIPENNSDYIMKTFTQEIILGMKNNRTCTSVLLRNIFLGIPAVIGLIGLPIDGTLGMWDTYEDSPKSLIAAIMSLPSIVFLLFTMITARNIPDTFKESVNQLKMKLRCFTKPIIFFFTILAAASSASILNINSTTFHGNTDFPGFFSHEAYGTLGITRNLSILDMFSIYSICLFNGSYAIKLLSMNTGQQDNNNETKANQEEKDYEADTVNDLFPRDDSSVQAQALSAYNSDSHNARKRISFCDKITGACSSFFNSFTSGGNADNYQGSQEALMNNSRNQV